MADEPSARRCFPPPCEEVGSVYEDVSFPGSHPADPSLPYVVMNMVSSLDGKVSSGGKSGSIGGGVDRGAMRMLRSKVDAVAVGAGTVRAEKVSLTSEGMRDPEPKAVIISASLDLPPENMASLGEQETIILTVEGRDTGNAGRSKSGYITGLAQILPAEADSEGGIDLMSALRALKGKHGVDRLLLEGGSALNTGMLSIGVVSEIFITIAPKLLGGGPGESAGILSGPLPAAPRDLSLASIHASTPDGEILLRYKAPLAGIPPSARPGFR